MRSAIKEQMSSSEVFHPSFNAPVLSGAVRLDFVSKDTEGTFSSPEGKLKSLVLRSTSAASSQRTSFRTHAASGMAGVGKTTALKGLGHDADIEDNFKDGVLFTSLGAEATVEKLNEELVEIMCATGATSSATEVSSSSSLESAVSKAARRFQGKSILFLVDDVWPCFGRPEGFHPELKGILQGNRSSPIVFSTRSREIAAKLGSPIDFEARNPHGSESERMFLSYASPSAHFENTGSKVIVEYWTSARFCRLRLLLQDRQLQFE